MQRHIRKSFLVIIFIFFAAAFSHTEIYGSIMDEYIQTPLFSYHDIKKVPWAENAIEVLSSYGIISGLPDGYFYPEAYITRAEYTKIIISAFGLYDDRANIQLSDSKPTDWHNKYIGSAVKHGIAQGVSWDYYGVDDYITREECL